MAAPQVSQQVEIPRVRIVYQGRPRMLLRTQVTARRLQIVFPGMKGFDMTDLHLRACVPSTDDPDEDGELVFADDGRECNKCRYALDASL